MAKHFILKSIVAARKLIIESIYTVGLVLKRVFNKAQVQAPEPANQNS